MKKYVARLRATEKIIEPKQPHPLSPLSWRTPKAMMLKVEVTPRTKDAIPIANA
jgi:hypothetical protein